MVEAFGSDPGWWHSLSTLEFCKQSGMGPETVKVLESKEANGSLRDNLVLTASDELKAAIPAGIRLPPEIKTALSKIDVIVTTWTLLSRENDRDWTWRHVRQVLSRLGHDWLDAPPANEPKIDFANAAAAFDMVEMPTANGQLPSQAVYDKLIHQHAIYDAEYPSPCTTIIGPSGIGKSFAVKQLAIQHGLYVVYANLSAITNRSYPRPTCMGKIPSTQLDDKSMVALWCTYIKNQVRLAEYCRAAKLMPSGLIHLLTSNRPELIQGRTDLEDIFRSEDAVPVEVIADAVSQKKVLLERLGLNSSSALPVDGQPDSQPTIICLDEARALFDGLQNNVFRTLQTAAKLVARDKAFSHGGSPSFFIVLLDTSSKISNFTPIRQFDPSAKVSGQVLYHPIHSLDTLDVLAPKSPGDQTGTPEAVRDLFSYGRPLWGALLQSGYKADSLLSFAMTKVMSYCAVDAKVYGVALLSYRMQFYISSTALAEEMVSSTMRYITAVAQDGASLRTTHPSEPVLALSAARLLQNPKTRHASITAWVKAIHGGMVNPGDLGEQVASLILLFAYDYVARPLDGLPCSIRLRDLLSGMFGAAAWDRLSGIHTASAHGLLAHGHVFFNHFVRLQKPPTGANLEAAYRRGMAMFLPPNFPGMDIAIPVRRTDSGRMSLLLIQAKNRKGDSYTAGLRMSMKEDLRTAAHALKESVGELHGTIGLVMCLRSQSASHCAVVEADEGRTRPATRSQRKNMVLKSTSGSERHDASPSPDLVAIVFGLDTTVYPFFKMPAKPKSREKLDVQDEYWMLAVCTMLKNLVETWPNAYAADEVASDYSQKLLDPFFVSDSHEGTGE